MQRAIVEVDPLVTRERLIVNLANACAGFLASLHACMLDLVGESRWSMTL